MHTSVWGEWQPISYFDGFFSTTPQSAWGWHLKFSSSEFCQSPDQEVLIPLLPNCLLFSGLSCHDVLDQLFPRSASFPTCPCCSHVLHVGPDFWWRLQLARFGKLYQHQFSKCEDLDGGSQLRGGTPVRREKRENPVRSEEACGRVVTILCHHEQPCGLHSCSDLIKPVGQVRAFLLFYFQTRNTVTL